MSDNSLVLRDSHTFVSLTNNSIFSKMSEGAIGYALEIAQSDKEKAEPAYIEGCMHLKSGEYSEAKVDFIFASELGHCAAQLQLANMFLEGTGTAIDYASAIYWFNRAAEQGETRAQLKLGWMSEAGLGNPPNSRRAVYWYRIAAEAGNAEAQFNIGVKYDNGEGVEHNPEEAARWYMMSAEQGFADARYFIGQALEAGDGIEKNMQEAIDWYILAAESGHTAARARFWKLCNTGDFQPESDEEAAFAEEIGAMLGNPDCMLKMALRYVIGKEKQADKEKAETFYKNASLLGHEEAFFHLHIIAPHRAARITFKKQFWSTTPLWILNDCGRIKDGCEKDHHELLLRAAIGSSEKQFSLALNFANGVGVIKDKGSAIYWYKRAAQRGHGGAFNNLGVIYCDDEENEDSIKKAFDCFMKATELGDEVGAYNLARHYENGEGTAKDIDLAVKYYKLSAERGFVRAMSVLGDRYYSGRFGKPDYEAAFNWYSEAEEHGAAEGKFGLGLLYSQGLGREKNEKLAKTFFEDAARKSGYHASRLATFLEEGSILQKDLVEAKKWREVAEKATENESDAEEETLSLPNFGATSSRRQRLLEKKRLERQSQEK